MNVFIKLTVLFEIFSGDFEDIQRRVRAGFDRRNNIKTSDVFARYSESILTVDKVGRCQSVRPCSTSSWYIRYIRKGQLREALASMDFRATDADIDQMFVRMNVDPDKGLDFLEFKLALQVFQHSNIILFKPLPCYISTNKSAALCFPPHRSISPLPTDPCVVQCTARTPNSSRGRPRRRYRAGCGPCPSPSSSSTPSPSRLPPTRATRCASWRASRHATSLWPCAGARRGWSACSRFAAEIPAKRARRACPVTVLSRVP